jgi:hypothetical protein
VKTAGKHYFFLKKREKLMKLFIFAVLSTAVCFNSVTAEIRLGNSSISYEQFAQRLRDERSDTQRSARSVLRLNTKISNNDFGYRYFGLPGQVEVNLVFEDGREVRGRVALTLDALDLVDRYTKANIEFGTLSIEKMNGIVGDLVDSYENEYSSNIIRVDVLSFQMDGPQIDNPDFGLILGGKLGLSRISGNIGVSRLYGDDAAASLTFRAEREKGAFLNNDLDYSLWSIKADYQHYISSNLHAEFFAQFENLSDHDRRDEDEERFSAGIRVQYYFLHNHGL